VTARGRDRCVQVQLVRKLLEDMEAHGPEPWANNYTQLLVAQARAGQTEKITDTLEQVEGEKGRKLNHKCYHVLLGALAEEGHWVEAVRVLKRMGTETNEACFGLALRAFLRRPPWMWQPALQLVNDMRKIGVAPCAPVISALVQVCCKAGELDKAVAMEARSRAAGFSLQVDAIDVLVEALRAGGRGAEAKEVLEGLLEASGREGNKDPYRLCRRVHALVRLGRGKQAMALAASRGVLSSGVHLYDTYVVAHAVGGQRGDMTQALEEVEAAGHRPHAEVYAKLADAVAIKGTADRALELLGVMRARGVVPEEALVAKLLRLPELWRIPGMPQEILKRARAAGCKPAPALYEQVMGLLGTAAHPDSLLALLNEMRWVPARCVLRVGVCLLHRRACRRPPCVCPHG
jgi:pentatricopeptide repeat protein